MSRSRFVALLAIIVLLTSSHALAGGKGLGFAQAQELARERGVPVVVDFFTDWCVYCKQFDRDFANPETGVAAALEQVVFASIDAEKGDGIELAREYGVTGFPTYVVVDAQGELIDRWSGYGGPPHFLDAYRTALADPTTMAQKMARFEKEPTAALAAKLAEVAQGEGEFTRAMDLYRSAERLEAGRDESMSLIYTGYSALRSGAEGFDLTRFEALLAERALREGASVQLVVTAAQITGTLERTLERPGLSLPYLKAAVARIESEPASVPLAVKTSIEIESLLKLRKDKAAAVALKKSTLPEDWQKDADRLNSFAWWCFESEANLEEAEALARQGIALATPGKQRASILDTAAEICNARGNCRDAVGLIERAIADDPDSEYYREQLERFQKLMAGGR